MAVIFYLSGTGNSLYVARQLQQAFSGCRLETIGSYLHDPYTVQDAEIGIVCPVYCFALPPAVSRFLQQLQAAPGYCFGVVTMGANAGFALKEMSSLLEEQGILLNYARDIVLPDNFFDVPQGIRQRLLEQADKKLPLIKKALQERTQNRQRVHSSPLWEYGGTKLAWKFMDKFLHISALKADAEKCIGCGICAKICPMGNIKLQDGLPVFGSNCACCLGCLHWCPQNAVYAGRKKIKPGRQYTHPKINLQDMQWR